MVRQINSTRQSWPEERWYPSLSEFLGDFDVHRRVYESLQTPTELELSDSLMQVGKQVRHGSKHWTRSDLADIARWKRLHPLMPRILRRAPDIDDLLARGLRNKREEDKIDALCRIPGLGPVLASAILMFTYPEDYGNVDYHTWNALRRLGFDLPQKDYGGSFTIMELLSYLQIVREMSAYKRTRPREIDKALHAFDRTKTKRKWKETFDSVKAQMRGRSPFQQIGADFSERELHAEPESAR